MRAVMRGSTTATVVWLAACGLVLGEGSSPDVDRGIDAVEEQAAAWTASPEPPRRALGARMLALLASPRWEQARDRLLEDPEPEVRLALLDGIAWMGDDDPAAIGHVLCELGEVSPLGDVWPGQAALTGIGKPVPFARLLAVVPPLRDRTSRLLYTNLRQLVDFPDPAVYGYLSDEMTVQACAEIVLANNDAETKRKLLVSRRDFATYQELASIDDRGRLREVARGGGETSRMAASMRLIQLHDREYVSWLEEQVRAGNFYAGKDLVGNPTWLADWNLVLPQLGDEAVMKLLFELRQGAGRARVEYAASELRRRRRAPDRQTILARTEGADAAPVRALLGLILGDASLARQGIEAGLPPIREGGAAVDALGPIESLVRSQAGLVLSLSNADRHSLFEPCFGYWERAKTEWTSLQTPRAAIGPSKQRIWEGLFAAGIFAVGHDFDVLWGAWRDEKDEELRPVILRALLSSPDPRACTLRDRLWVAGTTEQRAMVQDALPLESSLDRPVGSYMPSLGLGWSTMPTVQPTPLLDMLPALSAVPGVGPSDVLVAFAAELPPATREALNRATRRDVLRSIMRRAGVTEEDATTDRRRTIRHLGWRIEVDSWGGQPSFSEVAERRILGFDSRARWFDILHAHVPMAHVLPAPLDPAMVRDLGVVLDPASDASEWKRKVDALVERLRQPASDGISCGAGYREEDAGRLPWDPGFRALGSAARPHLSAHLDDKDLRVRHTIAALLWIVFLDNAGPKRLVTEAGSGDVATKESALRYLALIRWRDAAPLFASALDGAEPSIRIAGLWGIGRLRLKRSLPKVEMLVLDRDARVVRTACAVLHRFHGPESWRVLLPLLDAPGNDQRASAALVALGGFPRPEVIRGIVDRLPRLSWEASWALTSLTNQTAPFHPMDSKRDTATEVTFWREWLQRNGGRSPEEWRKDGVAQQLAAIDGHDVDGDRSRMNRLLLDVGPALKTMKPAEVGAWWTEVKDQPFNDLAWSALEAESRTSLSPESVLLLQNRFPDRAPGLLLEAMARAPERDVHRIHDALADLIGDDPGNPGIVLPELRADVMTRWRSLVPAR